MNTEDIEWAADFRKRWNKQRKIVLSAAKRHPKGLRNSNVPDLTKEELALKNRVISWHGNPKGAIKTFGLVMGLKDTTMCKKLNGERKWNHAEIERVCRILGISEAEKKDFFNPEYF